MSRSPQTSADGAPRLTPKHSSCVTGQQDRCHNFSIGSLSAWCELQKAEGDTHLGRQRRAGALTEPALSVSVWIRPARRGACQLQRTVCDGKCARAPGNCTCRPKALAAALVGKTRGHSAAQWQGKLRIPCECHNYTSEHRGRAGAGAVGSYYAIIWCCRGCAAQPCGSTSYICPGGTLRFTWLLCCPQTRVASAGCPRARRGPRVLPRPACGAPGRPPLPTPVQRTARCSPQGWHCQSPPRPPGPTQGWAGRTESPRTLKSG